MNICLSVLLACSVFSCLWLGSWRLSVLNSSCIAIHAPLSVTEANKNCPCRNSIRQWFDLGIIGESLFALGSSGAAASSPASRSCSLGLPAAYLQERLLISWLNIWVGRIFLKTACEPVVTGTMTSLVPGKKKKQQPPKTRWTLRRPSVDAAPQYTANPPTDGDNVEDDPLILFSQCGSWFSAEKFDAACKVCIQATRCFAVF